MLNSTLDAVLTMEDALRPFAEDIESERDRELSPHERGAKGSAYSSGGQRQTG